MAGGSRCIPQGARLGLRGDLEGWDWREWGGAQERGERCTRIADSRCCAIETSTTVQSNYTPIKIKPCRNDFVNSSVLAPQKKRKIIM